MTDLEATRLCAEAMRLQQYFPYKEKYPYVEHPTHFDRDTSDMETGVSLKEYWPLTNDQQAMALVKKMQLNVYATLDLQSRITRNEPADGWCVEFSPMGCVYRTHDKDLNRAIVYCVAAMKEGTIKNGNVNKG